MDLSFIFIVCNCCSLLADCCPDLLVASIVFVFLLSCACHGVEHRVMHAAVFFEISYHDSLVIANHAFIHNCCPLLADCCPDLLDTSIVCEFCCVLEFVLDNTQKVQHTAVFFETL